MDEIRYLGYILQKNGSDEKHIQDRKKRATIATKKTCSVRERIFKQDYKRRMKMYRALVESMALFGAEVWGWNMEERLDKVKRRYAKWILGLDMTTPNYILIEECKIIEIKEKALKRVARYEEKEKEKEVRKRKVILTLGSRRQPVAERSRGQGVNTLSNKGMG